MIIVGTIILSVVFVLIHYWKRILLLFAPFMGSFGRSLQARWRAEAAAPGDQPH